MPRFLDFHLSTPTNFEAKNFHQKLWLFGLGHDGWENQRLGAYVKMFTLPGVWSLCFRRRAEFETDSFL